MDIHLILLLFSAFSFIIYGINSFFSKRMMSEYERWGFKNQRIILGCCQLLGGLGLLVGLLIPLMLSVASFLLTCMMLTAVFVRIRIKESVLKMLPALLYVLVNATIFYFSIV
jgi:uncharacterized membrane protein YphA (DoxX/SURF4 family)